MIEHINNITNIKIEFLKYIELKYNIIKLSTIYQKQHNTVCDGLNWCQLL
jgi:hypothetical protein